MQNAIHLKSIAANQNELHLSNGNVIFFSYSTPVAAQLADGGFIRTDANYSRTTQKHITQWLGGRSAKTVPQSEINALL